MGSGPSPNLLENRGVEEVPPDVLRLCGGIGSPYSNKMLMYLRYRRIPHRFIMMNSKEEAGTKHARGPVLLPKILWPGIILPGKILYYVLYYICTVELSKTSKLN